MEPHTAELTHAAPALPLGSAPMILTPRPFCSEEEVQLVRFPPGLTLEEMLVALEGDGRLDPAVRAFVRVTVGDQTVPPALWRHARPKEGVPTFVHVEPGAGSSPVRTILQIAVIVMATFLPGAMGLYGLGAALASAATTSGGLLGIEVEG